MTFKKFFALLGLAFLLLIGWFLWQIFGPGPAIVVSKATTFITEPLRADGLPDYEKYILEKMREGVTPENNAAVLFWQAMGPGDDFQAGEFEIVAKEIGLENIPAEGEVLQALYGRQNRERVIAWLRQQDILPPADEEEDFERFGEKPWTDAEDLAERMIDHGLEQAWTSEQIPPLAEWVKANEKPLDLLVEASKRPRFYSPASSLLDSSHDVLIAMLLPGMQASRDAARALYARAMWHLGEGQSAKAWDDLHAMFRLARLLGQGGTLVEQLVSIAIEGIAVSATTTLLDTPDIPAELLRQIQVDLAALEPRKSMADSMDSLERICALDMLLCLRSGSTQGFGMNPAQMAIVNTSVDWNVPLRMLNEYYDEMVAAARTPTWTARQNALSSHEQRFNQVQQSMQPGRVAGAVLSRKIRSQVLGDVFAGLILPATQAALAAEDRVNTQLALVQLAAAIATYRAEHGEYPEKLEGLVPNILDKLPGDLFHDNPFVYRRMDNGYLLYSLGANGNDDGGSNQQMATFKGYSTWITPPDAVYDLLGDEMPAGLDQTDESERLEGYIPADADDYSIRLPLPKLELPKKEESE